MVTRTEALAPPPPPAPVECSAPTLLKTLVTRDPVTQDKLEFVVGKDLDFKDITDEYSRSYEFPNQQVVKIQSPAFVCNKPPVAGTVGGGSVRIIAMNGEVHYIPYGWLRLRWQTRTNRPTCAF